MLSAEEIFQNINNNLIDILKKAGIDFKENTKQDKNKKEYWLKTKCFHYDYTDEVERDIEICLSKGNIIIRFSLFQTDDTLYDDRDDRDCDTKKLEKVCDLIINYIKSVGGKDLQQSMFTMFKVTPENYEKAKANQ